MRLMANPMMNRLDDIFGAEVSAARDERTNATVLSENPTLASSISNPLAPSVMVLGVTTRVVDDRRCRGSASTPPIFRNSE
jgi:hypothetical protein